MIHDLNMMTFNLRLVTYDLTIHTGHYWCQNMKGSIVYLSYDLFYHGS